MNIENGSNFERISKIIISQANSFLSNLNLQLNSEKTICSITPQINNDIEWALYYDFVNDISFSIDNYYTEEKLENFINNINILIQDKIVKCEDYNKLIQDSFLIDDITISSKEIFNNLLYKDSKILKSKKIIRALNKIFEKDNQILKLDPARLTLLVLNTKDENLIKKMLNRLFDNERNGISDIYDIHIALTYLAQRNFLHKDLLLFIKKYDSQINNYILNFCQKSFAREFKNSKNLKNKFINNILKKDDKLYYLYSFYKIKKQECNYMEAFAYYKNYFDRVTAHFDAYINSSNTLNINKFYKIGNLKRFYSTNQDTIEKAHKVRNSNPLAHASSELIDDNNTKESLKSLIASLSHIIKDKISSLQSTQKN